LKNKHSNRASLQQKFFPFVVLVTFCPLSVYSFHVYGKGGVTQSSVSQVRSQCN
jgi:hypothetical protein